MSRRKPPIGGGDLVTFVPAVTFTGYPDGKTPVLFNADVESQPVPEEFVQMLREKGGHVAVETATDQG